MIECPDCGEDERDCVCDCGHACECCNARDETIFMGDGWFCPDCPRGHECRIDHDGEIAGRPGG